MRKMTLVSGVIAAMIAAGGGRAEEQSDCAVLARTFAIPPGSSELPDIALRDATVSLIGNPSSKTIGFSFKATVSPKTSLAGTEKLLLYLYVKCDEKPPAQTSGITVGIVPIATFAEGREKSTLITSVEASALVPLRNIQCVKLGRG